MVRGRRKRKCKQCRDFFTPDPRNTKRQKFCSKPECRKASKAQSQKRWLEKPENKDYFRGPVNVDRVREWRQAHPGYWRRKTTCNADALQETLSEKRTEQSVVSNNLPKDALQDLLFAQPPVLVGLIAQITGYALQDDIAMSARRLLQVGNDILNNTFEHKGGSYGTKTSHISTPGPQGSRTVQLGGSPLGP
jgi:hypothetical protein